MLEGTEGTSEVMEECLSFPFVYAFNSYSVSKVFGFD